MEGNKEKETALNKYIKEKHTTEECMSFIAGWEAAENRIKELEESLRIERLNYDNEIIKRKELKEIYDSTFNSFTKLHKEKRELESELKRKDELIEKAFREGYSDGYDMGDCQTWDTAKRDKSFEDFKKENNI